MSCLGSLVSGGMDKILRTSILILWLRLVWVSGQEKSGQEQVKQGPPSLIVQEGASSTLNCTYENTAFDYFVWYRQYPGQGPALLLAVFSVKHTKEDGRFTVFVSESAKQFSLHIMASQPGDSATYFCAASNRGSKVVFGPGTRLFVKTTIQNPDPAVYQLKSPESSNISVCLFTDFDSEVNVNPSTESNMIRLKSTSLDMKTMDSKSNGALAWSNSFDLGCNSTFNYTFHSSSEFPCDANVVEKGFETDMNLNFDNLTVIMFRIIFLKAVGFNLLMTLKLWSS